QRRIDDAGARAVPAGGFLLEHLDDFVAVARLLGDQRERDELQVALGEHPPGPHAVVAAPAVPAAPARPAEEASAARAPGAAALMAFVYHFVHFWTPLTEDIS